MQLSDITFSAVIGAVALIILCLNVYIIVTNARTAARTERDRRSQPMQNVEQRVAAHDTMLANDQRRMDRVQADVADIRDGQRAMIRGVQALLDHELHNGNSEQMEQASSTINSWLINGR